MVVKMNETRKAEEECLELIKNIPFVRKLMDENEKLKKEFWLNLNTTKNIPVDSFEYKRQ